LKYFRLIPVCGVEIRNEFLFALDAPFLNKVLIRIKLREQSGIGTPTKLIFRAAARLDFPIFQWSSWWKKYTLRVPANRKPKSKKVDISRVRSPGL